MGNSDDISVASLGPYLKAHASELGAVLSIEKFSAGQSNPTYKLECESGNFVLRTKPPGKLLKSAHMVEREFRAMRALAETSVPVPRMICMASDETSPIGRAFFVMSYVPGQIYFDPALPDCTPDERAAIYDAMNDVLARLHDVDVSAIGLSDFGKLGNYFARQTERWTAQYLASRAEVNFDMDHLIAWLGANMPADDGQIALVHGDFRLDNMVVGPAGQINALLDWELSTLGHPLADLAYQCMQWRLPNSGDMRGLAGISRKALSIPSEAEYVERYCARRGIERPENWEFYLAFCYFRLAAILEGVVARARGGNASNPQAAKRYASAIPILAHQARAVIEGDGA